MNRATSNQSLQELQREHDDLHEEIAGVKQFWTDVNELGQGPKYEDMASRVAEFEEFLDQLHDHESAEMSLMREVPP